MNEDTQIVREVRDRARSISAAHGHDLRRYAHHLRSIEKEHATRVVDQVSVIKQGRPRADRSNAA